MPKSRTVARRRSHPVVLAYQTGDRALVELLSAQPEPHPPVVRALLYLQECLARRKLAKQAIEAAQAVPVERSDPELLVLMLCSWAELSSRIGRPAEAGALMQRAKSLISERMPPEVRAVAVRTESVLEDRGGNKALAEEKLRAAVALVPADAPRHKLHVWDVGLFLAQQGRATDYEDELRALETQRTEHFGADRLLVVQFIDAVETGRADEALQLEAQFPPGPRLFELPAPVLVGGYQALLRLMTARAAPPEGPAAAAGLGGAPWVEVVRCLQRGQTASALKLARHEAERTLTSFTGGGFDAYNLVRAELAAGNAEAARRLLELRRDRGNAHYLDSLFLARVERLVGNQQAAGRRFAEALQAAARYRAQGRLDFELRLACEMSHADMVNLALLAAPLARQPTLPHPAPHAAATADSSQGVERIIGRNPAMVTVREMILRFAEAEAPVLITGETGTGKELVARALHAASQRRQQPFIAVNCGSIAESLLDSEMFGHRRGAFTGADRANKGLFEEAGEGTILLDEMGEILPRLQQALLRVLETGEIRAVGSATTRRIRCRILAATNADLNRLANEGRFRRDLLYRLQRLGIELPPLRTRREDIVLLARHFLDLGRPPGVHAALAQDLIAALEAYDWPGNVRELKNVIERMRLMHSDKLSYGLADLDIKFHSATPTPAPTRIPLPASLLQSYLTAGRRPETSAAARRPLGEAPIPATPDAAEEVLAASRDAMRRGERLRELFERFRKLTRSEIVRITGISPNTATKDLRGLCEAGFIERVEPGASSRSYYFQIRSSAGPS